MDMTTKLDAPDEFEVKGRMAHSRWLIATNDDGSKVYAEVTTTHHGRPSYEFAGMLNTVTIKVGHPFTSKSFGLMDGQRMRLRVEAKRFSASGLRDAHEGHVQEVRELFDQNNADIRAKFTR